MIRLMLLIFILIVSFSSCNRGKNRTDYLKASITKFKESIKPITFVKSIPKTYSEVTTDTILSNGYSVHIKTYANMKISTTNEYKIDTNTTIKEEYRHWISDVTIKKDGELIFNETIDSTFYLQNNQITKDHLSNMITAGVEVNQAFSLDENFMCLTAGIIFPKEQMHQFYNIKIDNKGNFNLNKLRAFKATI